MQPSANPPYLRSVSAPGSKVTDLALNGTPIDRVAPFASPTNDFLASRSDGFIGLTAGTGQTTAPGFGIDAFTAYLGGGSAGRAGPGQPHHRPTLNRPP